MSTSSPSIDKRLVHLQFHAIPLNYFKSSHLFSIPSCVPVPLFDTKPSCYGFLALTLTNKYSTANARRSLAAALGITPSALGGESELILGGFLKSLLLSAAKAF